MKKKKKSHPTKKPEKQSPYLSNELLDDDLTDTDFYNNEEEGLVHSSNRFVDNPKGVTKEEGSSKTS